MLRDQLVLKLYVDVFHVEAKVARVLVDVIVARALVGKKEEVAKEYDTKVLSAYNSTLEQMIFYIVEAASQQAVESYFAEIGFVFWNDVEIGQVKTVQQQ